MHESNLIPTLTIFLTFEIYCCCKSFFQIFTILKPFGYILKAVLCDYQIFAKSSAAVPSGAPLSLIHTSPFIRKGTMQCGVSSILMHFSSDVVCVNIVPVVEEFRPRACGTWSTFHGTNKLRFAEVFCTKCVQLCSSFFHEQNLINI